MNASRFAPLALAATIACACLAPAATVQAAPQKTRKGAGMTAAGPVDRTKKPELPPAPPLRLPQAQVQTLPNGLEIVVVEMHKAPVVDITVLVGAGAVRDPEDLPGLATFTANLLDEGAGARSALEIAEAVDFLGGTLTTSAGVEVAQVNLHVPRRHLAAALDLLADVTLRPTFPEEEIGRQKELRRTSLIQLRDQPNAIAPLAFNALLYPAGHPYGRPQSGNEASTEKLDRARVAGFYSSFYRPGNARVLVVGDVTPAEVATLFGQRFGAWEPAPVAAPPSPATPDAAPRAFYLVDKPGAAQSVIRIGHPGVTRSTPDYFALQVMNTILGGSFTSRLNQNLRETHGYTYGASSGFEMRRLAGPFRAAASVQTAKTDSSVIEFLKELRGIRDTQVPAGELEKAKAYLTLGMPGDFETTAGAAEKLVELMVNGLPLDSWEKYIPGIRAVTAEDVQRVARQHLDPDRFAIVVVGDRRQIEPGLAALNEGPIRLRDLWGAEPASQ
jgi:predicted Zn-dependent peptidase